MTVDEISLSCFEASPIRETIESKEKFKAPERPNLINILKRGFGKDLFRISVPVVFNEPISFLQRLAEDVEYSNILDEAANPKLEGTTERASLIAAFIISHYSSTSNRTAKPFNPLLGETFELISHSRNIALIAEQVSHHPPLSAIHVKGQGWTYYTSHEVKNKFLLNTIEVWPEGCVHIQFDDGEHYYYDQARTYVHNLLAFGDMWIENSGNIIVKETKHNKYITTIQLVQPAMKLVGKRNEGQVKGNIRQVISNGSYGKSLRQFSGNWKTHFDVDGKNLWKVSPRPNSNTTRGFNMTKWAWSLNSLCDDNTNTKIAKTDSRFRPDQRALEERKFELASQEKDRLEQNQRARRQKEEEQRKEYKPQWFEKVKEKTTGKIEWKYKENYFSTKHNSQASWPENVNPIF